MDSEIWSRKHMPSGSKEIAQAGYKLVRDFVTNFRKGSKKKALIIHGPTGSGKTCSVYVLARELGLEVMELNASDFRDSESISSIAGSASKQLSLFSRGKIILIDEMDGVSGQQDRGGVNAIAKLIDETSFPVILTANDITDRKFSQIIKKSCQAEYQPLSHQEIYSILERICSSESIAHEEDALKMLAIRAGGDLRGAINDLQVLSQSKRKLCKDDVNELSERNREGAMKEALLRIFKSTDISLAITAFEGIDEELQKCSMWVEENLPYEYRHPGELEKSFNFLSRADVFSGRIRRWQHWRFLVYINALISAGVAISKSEKNRHQATYQEPTRPLKIYIGNMKYAKRNSISEKIAGQASCSIRRAKQAYIPHLKAIFTRNREFAHLIAKDLELENDEVEWLKR